jgi:hypothetical protein
MQNPAIFSFPQQLRNKCRLKVLSDPKNPFRHSNQLLCQLFKLRRSSRLTINKSLHERNTNHALALAYHGKDLGVPVTVVMPTVAPLAKVDKCRKFGARIIIEGAHVGEAICSFGDILEKVCFTEHP